MKAKKEPGFGQVRSKLSEVLPLETPFTLNIAASTVCNFKCKYCVHSLDKDTLDEKGFKPQIMDWSIFEKTLEDAKQFSDKFKVVTFTGNGESLCNKNLHKMIKAVKDSDIAQRTEFITNAELLTNKVALDLIEAGLDTIRISIQGLSTEKYKEVCGKVVDLNKFIKQIEFLYEHKGNCEIYIKIIDVALDEGEEDTFYNMFGNISDRIFIEKIMPVFDGVDYSDMITENRTMDRYGNIHEKRLVCPQVFFTLTVWPNGNIYPCDVLDDPAFLGNIKDVSLKDVWNGEKRREFLIMQLDKKRMDNSVCKNCCAPDDVSQSEDDLDNFTSKLKKRFEL